MTCLNYFLPPPDLCVFTSLPPVSWVEDPSLLLACDYIPLDYSMTMAPQFPFSSLSPPLPLLCLSTCSHLSHPEFIIKPPAFPSPSPSVLPESLICICLVCTPSTQPLPVLLTSDTLTPKSTSLLQGAFPDNCFLASAQVLIFTRVSCSFTLFILPK